MSDKSCEESKDLEIIELRFGGFEIISRSGTMQFRRGVFESRAHAEEALKVIQDEKSKNCFLEPHYK